METSSDKNDRIPWIEKMPLDAIAKKILWPKTMDRIGLYHFRDNLRPVVVEIQDGKLTLEEIWIDTLSIPVKMDGVKEIGPNGDRSVKLIGYATYDLRYPGGSSALSLVDTRFRPEVPIQVSPWVVLGVIAFFPISIALILALCGGIF
jgi:hypothetical protein